MSLYSLSLSGLNTAQTGLEVTSHNIDNSATPGYDRQVVVQQTAGALATGSGYIGMGVNITTIQRQYDSFLSTQLMNSQSLASQYNTQYTQLSQIDGLLATSTTSTSATLTSGIQPALTNLFSSLNAAASDPSNAANRQDMVGKTSSLVAQVNLVDQQMQNQRQGINTQLGTTVKQINSDLGTINQLNQQISAAYGQSGGQPPNDMLDERDKAISDLGQLIGIQTYTQSNTNTVSISLAGGQPLLSGTTEYKLSAATSSSDPTAQSLYYSIPGPNGSQTQVELKDSQVTGGSVGGLMAFRQQLNAIQNQLGQFAVGLAMTMNGQQEQGLDLNGNPGSNIFSLGSSNIVAGANSGSASLNMTAQSGKYSISYDGTSYAVKDPSGSAVTVATTTDSSGNTVLNFNGFSVTVTGGNDPRATATSPDSWTMQPFGMTTPTVTASSTNGQQNISYNIAYTGGTWQVTGPSGAVASTTTVNGDGTTTLAFDGFKVTAGAGTVTSGDSWTFQSSGTGSSITAAATNSTTDPSLTASSTTASAPTLTANVLGNGDYKVTYNGTAYTVNDPSGNAVTNATGGTAFTPNAQGDIVFHGMVIKVSGNAASGDSWQIDPDGMAQVPAISNTHNTSTASLSASYVDASKLQSSDYSIVYSGGTSYQVTRESDGTLMNLSPNSQGNLVFDGLSVSTTGTPAAGDKWELQPTRNAAGLLTSTLSSPSQLALADAVGGTTNGNNGLAMAKLQTAAVLNNGTVSLNGLYAQLVNNVGVQTQQLNSSLTAQNALVTQQTSAVSSVSGVNLNEEYVNLTQYQQQYQASAKILDVASTIFNAILGAVG
ncbi:flagellar hook-associated protein FlgK [Bordetella sp. FB-8]|uniref:flagellar hook-associated protein FlgK n=1 Tax=Bordetella sp. FB-8 TaxID=1159870 RepID=UPI00036E739B|nr:flagellar hook-associated protein FlgK [Bordetella sp. FB-8]